MCDDTIDVEMNEYQVAEAPTCLRTHSLGPCIGIGVVDLDTHRGFLIHDPALAVATTADCFFEALMSCSKNVKITVAGGDMSDDEPDDESVRTEVGSSRKRAIEMLRTIFPDVAPTLFWCPSGGSCWISVNPSGGEITRGLD